MMPCGAFARTEVVYVYYPAGGGTHRRGPEATYRDQWGWDFKYMRQAEDFPSNEYYYKDFNSGWTGTNDMLTQALGAKGYELKYGGTNSYDWLCAGYRDNPNAPAATAFDPSAAIDADAPQFGDLRLYEGFLKCLYTDGMLGGCAGYFSFPKGGFGGGFPEDKPPHWLVQMVVLARVHALFSHFELSCAKAGSCPDRPSTSTPRINRLTSFRPANPVCVCWPVKCPASRSGC